MSIEGDTARLEWSDPQPIAGGSAPAAIQAPVLALGIPDSYVVGLDIPFFDDQVSASPLVAALVGGSSVGRPAGRFAFHSPRATLDGTGRLHVVWGEGEGHPQRPSDRRGTESLTELWTASFSRRRGWDTARLLYRGAPLHWDSQELSAPTSPAAVDAPRHVASIVTPEFSGQPGEPLIALILGDAGWSADRIPVPPASGPVQASLVVSQRRWVLAYLSADHTAPGRDINSVFIRRSDDDGEHWGEPVLVQRSGRLPAGSLRLLQGPEGDFHLVWLQRTGERASVIRHRRSRDGGATWESDRDVGAAAERSSLRAVIDQSSTIHVVVENWGGGEDGVHLEYARWNGDWSTLRPLFPGWRSYSPALALSHSGQLAIAFVRSRADLPVTTPSSTMISWLRPSY